MANRKQSMTVGKLNESDAALLYISPCSDVDASFEHSRRFIECLVEDIPQRWSDDVDYKYRMHFADKVRENETKNGADLREALVSIYSQFLFTWEEFGKMKSSKEYREQRLQKIASALRGEEVEEPLRNWQQEHLRNIKDRKLDVEQLIENIRDDFEDINTPVVLFSKSFLDCGF